MLKSSGAIPLGETAAAPPGRPARSSFIGSVAGLLRHHGVWSPGVLMFRNLAFVSKAVVISATFIFMYASNHAIHASERELAGVAHVHELAVLRDSAQDMRHAILAAAGKPTPALAEQLARVEAQLARVEVRLAPYPALAEASKFVRDAFTPIKNPVEDRAEAFTRADEFVQQGARTNRPG